MGVVLPRSIWMLALSPWYTIPRNCLRGSKETQHLQMLGFLQISSRDSFLGLVVQQTEGGFRGHFAARRPCVVTFCIVLQGCYRRWGNLRVSSVLADGGREALRIRIGGTRYLMLYRCEYIRVRGDASIIFYVIYVV